MQLKNTPLFVTCIEYTHTLPNNTRTPSNLNKYLTTIGKLTLLTNECIPDADFLSNSVEVHEPSFETVVMMLQLCELPNVSSTDGKFHHTDITPRVGLLPSVRLDRSHHRLRQYRKSFAPIREFH